MITQPWNINNLWAVSKPCKTPEIIISSPQDAMQNARINKLWKKSECLFLSEISKQAWLGCILHVCIVKENVKSTGLGLDSSFNII